MHKSPQPRWRILSAGFHHAAKNVHMPLHHHTYWEFVYYQSGTVECLIQDKTRPGHVGLYWLTPPGINHGENAVTDYACYWFALDYAAKADWPVFLEDDHHQAMGRVCQQIVTEWGGKSAGRERMLELLCEEMGCLLDRAAAERILSPAEQIVLGAERWIEEHCGGSLAIQDVARHVGVSPSALRNYFKVVRGHSPRHYLQQIRLDKAVRFLRTSTLKLEALAELCGYDSASHLTRYVKRSTGKTPGQIRHGK